MRQKNFTLGMLFFLVGFVASALFAVDASKISGRVTDAQTREGLAGANIILKGWNNGKLVDLDRPMGAITNLNGEYFVLNVPPGKYALMARFMGYAQLQISDVSVNMGRIIEVNFPLKQSAIEGEQMNVTAKREVVQADVSTSQIILTQQETTFLPRNTIQEVLSLTPGVSINSYDNRIDIRGGGSDQVMSYLDGFSMKDNVFNTPFLSYNRTSIEEITIQTGGFQAEYGELRSGLINVLTKEGGRDYNVSVDFKYSPPGIRYDGPKRYTQDKNYLIYGSDWSMSEDLLKQKFPNPADKFVGWPKYQEPKFADTDPTNDLSPNQARDLWLWQHRGRSEGQRPDYIVDATLNGPFPGATLPFLGSFFSRLSFMLSYRNDYVAYEHPSYRDHFLERTAMVKLKYKVSDASKLSFLGMFSNQWGNGYMPAYLENTPPTIMRSDGGGGYVEQNRHLADGKLTNFGLHYEYIVSPSTFFEIRLSRMANLYDFHHGPLRDSTKVKTIPGEFYALSQTDTLHVTGLWDPKTNVYMNKDTTLFRGDRIWCPPTYWDETPDGWVQPNVFTMVPDQVGKVDLDDVTPDFERSRGSNTIIRLDITSQVNPIHQIKSGIYYTESVIDRDYYKIADYNFKLREGDDKNIRYTEQPLYGAVYFQDRMEIKGLVGNFGVRGEYFDANTHEYLPNDPFSNYFFVGGFWENLSRVPWAWSKKVFRVSPRLGISFPMTVNSKIYFNYGHAYNAPDNRFRYGFMTQPAMMSRIQWRGNPDLEPPKTVQYSLGYEHVLFDKYLVHTEIFYKDVTNEIGNVSYINCYSENPTAAYATWVNKVYEDIIGWEFRLHKRYGTFLTGWLQMEFRGQKSGEIGYMTRYVPNDPNNVSEFSQYTWPDDFLWEWQPAVMLNVDFHTPMNWGPKVMGYNLFGGWRINSIINWAGGSKFTWNPTFNPRIHNNMQYANSFRGDFFFSKDLKIGGSHTSLYVDVRNLISRKLLNVGVLEGPSDIPGKEAYLYYSSLEMSKGDRVGHYKAGNIIKPSEKPGENYIYRVGGPVRVYMGFQFNFN